MKKRTAVCHSLLRKFLSLLLALSCLVFAGCIDPERTDLFLDESASAPPPTVRHKLCASYPTLGSTFYATLNGAIQNAVTAQDDRLIVLDASGDINTQILQIEDMLTEGIDVLFLVPTQPAALRPLLETLQAQNIPVINLAVPVENEDLVRTVLLPDMQSAGQLCADDALVRLPGGGQVLVFEQPDNPLATAAVAAWDAHINGDAWPALARLQADDNAEQASALLGAYLQENPGGVDIIFAGTDTVLPGIISALTAANVRPGSVLIYAVGGSPDTKRLIRDGWVSATTSQSPAGLGTQAASTAYQILDGGTPQTRQLLPTELITGENIGNFSFDGWD